MRNKIKKIIKKILPKNLLGWIKNHISFPYIRDTISKNYQILENPNLIKLRAKYNNAWKDSSIPQKQLKLSKKEIPNFINVAPMKALINLLKKFDTNGKNLLEIGCSNGYYSEVLKKAGFNINYEGCDYSEKFIKLAKKRYPTINFKISNATKLDYNDNQFDIVISGCCILHIVDYALAIKETVRVAKKNVIFHRTPMIHKNKTVFTTKTGYDVEMLEILFNEEELIDLFNKNGLVVKNINSHSAFSVKDLDEPVFMKSYLCQKMTKR